jgi:alkanesulfonate monooxygenase SsuD/methylene tetrahydromethanopterin reductase-like flavin-dependent oxidoreductase (luciferase family)
MRVEFGYCVEAPVGWRELIEVATELDAASRFDSFWISDGLVANGRSDEPRLDAWTALAAIARETSRLRLGVLVSGNAYRHPAVLAKVVTTIDQISEGRVELGFGAGWPGENRRYGIDFWARRERIARFEEAVQVIKYLWTQQNPAFNGQYYRLDAPAYSPPNVQQPHPPILIGGGSDSMLRIIARYADKANPMIAVGEAIAKVSAYCHEAGRAPDEIRWTNSSQLFLHDDPAVQRRAIEWATRHYGSTEEEIRRPGTFGSLIDVIEGVRRQVNAGIREVIVFQLPRVHMKSLQRFSDRVIPAFG